jgi:ribosomal protein S18 acetylase RimI-like enzyme
LDFNLRHNERGDFYGGTFRRRIQEGRMNFNPSEGEIDFVNNALARFNDEKVGPDNHELLNIVEYDADGNVIAGILGGTYWGWMHIDILWVDEKFRKQGIGSKLLQAAEDEAKRRGCHSVHVDTMSWQAPDFYKKHGYVIISELDDIPKGNKKYHLIKKF